MITKVQSATTQQPAFTAKWSDARKVIASLPEQHDLFKGLNYTLDNQTISTKAVLLARLDKAVEVVKNKFVGGVKKVFNLDMSDYTTLFKTPKKFLLGFKAKDFSALGEAPCSTSGEYRFKRNIIDRDDRVTTLHVLKKDSIENIARFLLNRGTSLVKELKKAGLDNPKEIEI